MFKARSFGALGRPRPLPRKAVGAAGYAVAYGICIYILGTRVFRGASRSNSASLLAGTWSLRAAGCAMAHTVHQPGGVGETVSTSVGWDGGPSFRSCSGCIGNLVIKG